MTPYERGWLDADRKKPRANPFPPGSGENSNYDRGYQQAVQEYYLSLRKPRRQKRVAKVRQNFRINPELYQWLRTFARGKRTTLTRVVETACAHYRNTRPVWRSE